MKLIIGVGIVIALVLFGGIYTLYIQSQHRGEYVVAFTKDVLQPEAQATMETLPYSFYDAQDETTTMQHFYGPGPVFVATVSGEVGSDAKAQYEKLPGVLEVYEANWYAFCRKEGGGFLQCITWEFRQDL